MKSKYPQHILPREGYVNPLKIDDLLKEHQDLFLVRQLPGNKDNYMHNMEGGGRTLSPKLVFKNQNLANYSLNLSGGKFNTKPKKDLRFLPEATDGGGDWHNGFVSKEICKAQDSYKITEPCCGLIIRARDLHHQTFPSTRSFNNPNEYETYLKEVDQVISIETMLYDKELVGKYNGKKGMVNIKGRVKINHRPTKMNYWHYTMDTYRPNELTPIMSDQITSRDKRMFEALKQNLLNEVAIDITPDYKIKRKEYDSYSRIKRMISEFKI